MRCVCSRGHHDLRGVALIASKPPFRCQSTANAVFGCSIVLRSPSCHLERGLVGIAPCKGGPCRGAVMARFRHDFATRLTLYRVRRLSLSLSLSLSFVAGAPASPVPVALDAIGPWQTPDTSAVEAVEPCSRPLLFQQSWCVYGWLDTSCNCWAALLKPHRCQLKLRLMI